MKNYLLMSKRLNPKNCGDDFWESRYGQHQIEEILLKEVEDRRAWELFEDWLQEQEILEHEAQEKVKEMEKEEKKKEKEEKKKRKMEKKKKLDDGKNQKISKFFLKKKKLPSTIPFNFKNK